MQVKVCGTLINLSSAYWAAIGLAGPEQEGEDEGRSRGLRIVSSLPAGDVTIGTDRDTA